MGVGKMGVGKMGVGKMSRQNGTKLFNKLVRIRGLATINY